MGEEVSPGGSEIFRHEVREREFEPTGGDPDLIEAIDGNLEASVTELLDSARESVIGRRRRRFGRR